MRQVVDRCDPGGRSWIAEAIRLVEADANRSADTHLHVFPLPPRWGIDLYLKDESVHPTGSLKHRLARSLFLYGLANGWIREGTTIIEASSGSTAVSEAYFARLLGLPFVAVMPASTSVEKIELIEFYGGRCHLVDDPSAIYAESRRLAAECGGHFMDQFTYAERATDWRGNNNIAESIFEQLGMERFPEPSWIVVGAGTGGTSATIGRYARYRRFQTRVAVVDPEGSAFFGA
ncbi:PLP-dependent cysteine synthase family protein, partial [Actinomadura adrarensis]